MKDDYGRTWKKEDYGMAVICIALILIAVTIPVGIWGSVIYVFDLNKSQIFGGTIGIIFAWLIIMIYLELKWSKERRIKNELFRQMLKRRTSKKV